MLVFDVMGTVVDIDGSARRNAATTLDQAGYAEPDAERFLAAAEQRLSALMDDVVEQRRPWQRHRELRRLALRDAAERDNRPALPTAVEDELSGVISRLEPWPDAPAGLRALQESFVVAALSNADLAELAGLSAYGGLSWHVVLSGELVRSFKPDPAVYALVPELLNVEPAEVLMVAAHPWDLRAAAAAGFATAYIGRPGAELPAASDAFDLAAADLVDLGRVLSARA